MIRTFLPSGNSMDHEEWAIIKEIDPITPNVGEAIEVDICVCDCPHEYLVLAKAAGPDYQNDTSPFLYRLILPTDFLTLSLNKNGVEVVADLSSTPLGTHFPAGTFTAVPGQELYIGHQIEWEQVLVAHLPGEYTIVATGTIIGQPFTQTSQTFTLLPYDSRLADGTVRLRWFQSGNILSNEFDYTGMNWEQEIRIPGQLWNKKPTLTRIENQTLNRVVTQIQSTMEFEYTLDTKFIPFNLANLVLLDAVLGNEIFVTDYNYRATEEYIELPLYVKETDSDEKPDFKGKLLALILSDREQNDIKRNNF